MHKILPAALLGVLVAGCATIDSSGGITATPAAFPHPGLYSVEVTSGVLTYRIDADGTGRSCHWNEESRNMFLSELVYDGRQIHTRDAATTVESVTPERLATRGLLLPTIMERVEEAPNNCKEFLGQYVSAPSATVSGSGPALDSRAQKVQRKTKP